MLYYAYFSFALLRSAMLGIQTESKGFASLLGNEFQTTHKIRQVNEVLRRMGIPL